jgi:hypothetical protein
MTKNDMLIIYQQGIYDENNNISVKEYTDKVLNKAYMLGRDNAKIGKTLTDEKVLKIIEK